MSIKNYVDEEFLYKILTNKEREIFARITALTFSEKALEFIEGKITGGSINIDGNSIVRRTCQLTLVAQELNITDFYWGLKNKFKLEIGLKNNIDSNYPDIIWFNQGLYIITSFSSDRSTNGFNISISGKDKMCLLNGDLAGSLPHTTDFGVEEEYDSINNTTIYTNVPIRRIIYQSLQTFGNELPNNIIINDIEDNGLDLLEYKGDVPIYLFKNINSNIITNMTLNSNQKCIINESINGTIKDIQNFDTLGNLLDINNADIIQFRPEGIKYTVIKLEYGMNAGYRLTDLIYAGDLIGNVGESLTSIYDKIVNMLGEYEYFYDVDGRFIFQKKKTYVNTPWNSIVKNEDQIYADAAINSSSSTFNLLDGQLVISFQNTPNLLNLRNDFVVWGKKKTTSGSELDIHMRYAIDIKPTSYKSISGELFTVENYDWRELIYQMALDYRKYYFTDDDFLFKIAENNPQYKQGKTGYEQYYIDLEGFWRLLYNPFAEKENDTYYSSGENKYWNKNVIENPENLIFWFDFLDAQQSDLAKYSVPAIGARTKVINDNDIKTIYYRDIPNVIFLDNNVKYTEYGYTYLQLQPGMESLFTISSKGKSCKEKIDELLYNYSYCIETINLTVIPIYTLKPNTRITVRDSENNISGEYIINKITIPLNYNGTMTIGATKSVTSIN